ncbi:hypothetical protein B484DRAFT_409281 [Ochromonadaceae sp. CCMP2298]|nr:hypothetical protein B484DRAFT_409281 [Ochromonadaceae sp. CCMP2298]
MSMDLEAAADKAPGKGFSPLPDDVLLRVASYLWFHDLFAASAVDRRARALIVGSKPVIYDLMANLFVRNGGRCIDPQRINDLCGFSCTHVLRLCSRFAYWPTDIDTDLLRYNVEEVQLAGQTSRCASYTGRQLGYNRSLLYESAMAGRLRSVRSVSATAETPTVSPYPFTKLVYDPSLQCTVPIISGIAYYELTIHPPVANTKRGKGRRARQDEGYTPCEAIGIANSMHDVKSMPGWNQDSYGFHGDDGCFYHNDSLRGVQFTSDPAEAVFGVGDTVG